MCRNFEVKGRPCHCVGQDPGQPSEENFEHTVWFGVAEKAIWGNHERRSECHENGHLRCVVCTAFPIEKSELLSVMLKRKCIQAESYRKVSREGGRLLVLTGWRKAGCDLLLPLHDLCNRTSCCDATSFGLMESGRFRFQWMRYHATRTGCPFDNLAIAVQ